MAKRKPALLLTLGTAIAFITGGSVAYWWLRGQSGLQSPASLPVGIEVIPQNALMTFSVSTSPQQWQTLRSFGTPESQEQVDQLLARWRDRWLSAYDLDFPRDLQSWIGPEMTVAVLPGKAPAASGSVSPDPDPSPGSIPDSSVENGSENDSILVAILPIIDPLQAEQTLSDRLSDTEPQQEQVYQGVTLQEFVSQTGQSYAAAVFENQFIAIAPSLDVLQTLVDADQANAGIDTVVGYQDALSQTGVEQPFLRLYVNIPEAQAIAATGDPSPLPSAGLSSLSQNQGLAATLTLENQGIRIQTQLWRSAEQATPTITNEITDIAKALPDTTILMLSGSNLRAVWQQYSQEQPEAPPNQPNASPNILHPDALRQGLQAAVGLDLDQDFMSWMTGEFALGIIPIANPTAPDQTSAGVLVIAKASDRSAAEQTLASLDDVMSRRYRFEVSESNLGGEPVTTWTQPFSGLTIVRGWLEGDRAFLAIRGAVADTVVPQPQSTLADSSLYQTLTSNDARTNGQFFVNVEQLLNPQAGLPIPPTPDRYTPYISALQAIGVTTRSQTPQSTLYDIYVMLKQGRTPGPLPEVDASASPAATDPDTPKETSPADDQDSATP